MSQATEQGLDVQLICDSDAEGIFCAIGITYLAHCGRGRVRLARKSSCQARIGEVTIESAPSSASDSTELADRVYQGFEKRCGRACATRAMLACASDDPDVPEVVHRYVTLGFGRGSSLYLDSHLDVPQELNRHARFVLGECEHTKQFVRFSKLEGGTYFATFGSKADTLPLCARHFSNRMREDAFVLLDPKHLTAVYHEPHAKDCLVTHVTGELMDILVAEGTVASDEENEVQALWRTFYNAMTLPGRDVTSRGYDLRAHWIPQRFWSGLTELAPID